MLLLRESVAKISENLLFGIAESIVLGARHICSECHFLMASHNQTKTL